MKYFIALVITAMSALFIIPSCTSSKENKIEQTWKLIDISMALPENVIELWEFKGGKFYAFHQTNDTIILTDSVDSGWYQVKGGLFSSSVSIQGCSIAQFNDDWEIKKLKKDAMILMGTKDNSFVYKEFVNFPK